MQWEMLTGPVIGAVIGYVTNKIAVDMLFKPLNPIYIGKFRVPFTPGIIPKGKNRLGKAIGAAVGNNLLPPEVIKQTLLSDEMIDTISKQIDKAFESLSAESSSISTKLQPLLSESALSHMDTAIVDGLTHQISSGLSSMDLGKIIAEQVMEAVHDKVQGTMVAMFVKPSLLAPIEAEIEKRVNRYIEEHGEEKVGEFIQEKYTSIKEQPISSFLENQEITEIKEAIIKLYKMAVDNYAETLLASLNLAKIVEEKVCAMDTKEVEKLVLAIMEKELGAVVNLGAVIGFILGLINMFF